MKSLFFSIAVCLFITPAGAQLPLLPYEVSYPPAKAMVPYRNFQIRADGTWNRLSKFTSYKNQLIDQGKDHWINMDSTVCFYNAQMLMTLQIQYHNANGVWVKTGKAEFNTDTNGNPASTFGYTWDKDQSLWLPESESNYTFDTGHHIKQLIMKQVSPNIGRFENIRKNDYTYNAKGKEVQHIEQVWNNETSAWINGERISRTYDASDHDLTTFTEKWDRLKQHWVNDMLFTNIFDTVNNITSDLTQKWDTNGWVNRNYDVTWFDASNQLTRYENYEWIPEKPECQVLRKVDTWTYDTTGKYNKAVLAEHEWNIRNDNDNIRRGETRLMTKDSVIIDLRRMNTDDPDKIARLRDSTALDNYGNAIYYSTTDQSEKNVYHTLRYIYYYKPYNTAPVAKDDNALQISVYSAEATKPEVYLQLNAAKNSSIDITLYNTKGEKLHSEKRQLLAGFNTVFLSYKKLAAGTYRIEALEPTSQKKSVLKWVVKGK